MGYHLNRLDEPVFMAGPKPMRTEFGIHLRLESCVLHEQQIGVISMYVTPYKQGGLKISPSFVTSFFRRRSLTHITNMTYEL